MIDLICNRALGVRFLLTIAFVWGAIGSSGETIAAENSSAQQSQSLEQQLAKAFAPIVMLKAQEHECDRNGEAYLPAPVEVVFDDPQTDLVLMTGSSRTDREVITTAPNETDLTTGEGEYHLDFPGNPRNAGCVYERWFRQQMAGHEPAVYANVIANDGYVVVQYWFWYVFNDFNNTHEGDWEMIQLVFEADSVADALAGQPIEVGYSSHSGGERAEWTDDKLSKEGNHPIVYPGAGSHANKFGSGVYMAWGEDNSGFGCDVTTGPSVRLEPEVILVPNDLTQAIGPGTSLAWTGRWGERQPAFYNGPNSPGGRERWTNPFPWQDQLRASSFKVPESFTFGPGPTSAFCTTIEYSSFLLTRFGVYPEALLVFLASVVAAIVLLFRVGWPVLRSAGGTYRAHWRVFVAIGLVLVPVGLIANAVQFVFIDYPPGKQFFETMDKSRGARLAIALTIGGLQELIGLILIGPAVIAALGDSLAGRTASFGDAYRQVFRRFRPLLGALARSVAIITLLAVSIVGIPWAIARVVRWLFVSQAVLLDDANTKDALNESAKAVAGRWWRTAANALFLGILAIAPGPLVGIALLIVLSPEVKYVNWLSSLIYVVVLPLTVIAYTLLYLDLKGERRLQPAKISGREQEFGGTEPVSPAAIP